MLTPGDVRSGPGREEAEHPCARIMITKLVDQSSEITAEIIITQLVRVVPFRIGMRALDSVLPVSHFLGVTDSVPVCTVDPWI